jgi:hypothetical protein
VTVVQEGSGYYLVGAGSVWGATDVVTGNVEGSGLEGRIRAHFVTDPNKEVSMRIHAATGAALVLLCASPLAAQRRIPKDLSGTRGFNYQSAPTTGHTEHWLQYSAAETERDLDYAQRLQLNQVRVFIPWAAWEADKEAFRKNLRHFVRAAHERGSA